MVKNICTTSIAWIVKENSNVLPAILWNPIWLFRQILISETELLPRVKFFFKQAAEHGVPCLWWQDFFIVESKIQFWLYKHERQEWGRPQILKAIKEEALKAGSKR